MDEDDESAASTLVTGVLPFTLGLDEGFPEGSWDIFLPIGIEEVFVKALFEKLGAFASPVTVIDGKPF